MNKRKQRWDSGLPKFTLTPGYFQDRSIPEPNTGCWFWLGGIDKEGYGGFKIAGHPYMSAHRGSFIAHHGDVADGLTIDHLCRIRCCVNPDHLEAVTHAENCARRVYSDFCPNGHFKDGIKHTRKNRPYCKQCNREAHARMKLRKIAARVSL